MDIDPKNSEDFALNQIRSKGGVIQTKYALKLGIHQRTLRTLTADGRLEKVSRGVYRIPVTSLANPDLFTVASRVPKSVVCLISALSYHHLTTQIPKKVFIALARSTETPRLDWPPLSVHRFSGKAFSEGVEIHKIDGIDVRVYSPEKTLVDCFKFRNKIGLDVVLESLRIYRSTRKIRMADIYRYARICRVEKVMQPYLEMLL